MEMVGWLVALFSLIGLIVAGITWLYLKVLRPLILLIEDWAGQDGRPGVPRRLGVMERLANIDRGQTEHATRIGVLEERMSAVEARQSVH